MRKATISFVMFVFPSALQSTWNNSAPAWSKMYIGLYVKYHLFLSDFNENWIFLADLKKYSNIVFHANTWSGSRFVPRGPTDRRTDGRSVGRTDGYDEANNRFRNLANASKMARSSYLKITDRGKWREISLKIPIKSRSAAKVLRIWYLQWKDTVFENGRTQHGCELWTRSHAFVVFSNNFTLANLIFAFGCLCTRCAFVYACK